MSARILVFAVSLGLLGVPRAYAQTGYLHISSEPAQAEVNIGPGDKFRGTTPFKIELPAGRYPVRVKKEFYDDKEVSITIRADRVEKLHIKLEQRPGFKERRPTEEAVAAGTGTLTIITDIDGASIWIDGIAAAGKTPLTIDELQAGRHKVRLEYHGQFIERDVLVPPKQTVKVVESFRREREVAEQAAREAAARAEQAAREAAAREEAARRQREAQAEREIQRLLALKEAARHRFIGTWSPQGNRDVKFEISGSGLAADQVLVKRYTIFSGRKRNLRDDIGYLHDNGKTFTVTFRYVARAELRQYPGATVTVSPEYDVSEVFELTADGRLLRIKRRSGDTKDQRTEAEEALLVRE